MEIHKQTTLVEKVGTIKGRIINQGGQKGPVIVLRFIDQQGVPVLMQSVIANEKGEYELIAAPGRHYIAAFIDANNDRKFQSREHGNFYGNQPSLIQVDAQKVTALEPVVITGCFPKISADFRPIDHMVGMVKNIGKLASLDDPEFTPENYEKGFWKPVDFLKDGDGGVFLLEPYHKEKIPVLLIHGVNNGPTLWKPVVAAMDRQAFQPWVAFYPSGLRLDMISDYLSQAMVILQNKYGFKKFYVVAHSMGGLVARSFIKKYIAQDSNNVNQIGLTITVNSPMAGMASASAGVNHSPIVMPSWRDVAPDSAFLHGIHDWQWPAQVPYHLVISHLESDGSDGVVPLESQARWKLQTEAARIYLFTEEHTHIISNSRFHDLLNHIFERPRADLTHHLPGFDPQ